VKVHINSILLQTSTAGGGGGSQSFLITETFSASGTWTRPTGVDYLVAVAAWSGGNGGDGGTANITRTGQQPSTVLGGNPGAYSLVRDLYVGDQSTISIGIGAGGAGGLGGTATKPGTALPTIEPPTLGAPGGATTFGSYLTCTPNASNTSGTTSAAFGTVTTSTPFSNNVVAPAASIQGTASYLSQGYFQLNGFSEMPYQSFYPDAGQNGADGTATGATTGGSVSTGGVLMLGGAGGGSGYIAGKGGIGGGVRLDGGGVYVFVGSTIPSAAGTTFAGSAQAGAGGGGGSGGYRLTGAGTVSATGGNGGNASANSGAGGGGGGQASWGFGSTVTPGGTATFATMRGTAIGGNGGNGGDGFVIIAYIG